MESITQQEITNYIETNIQGFHQRRLDKLRKLKLMDVVSEKIPIYLRRKTLAQYQNL